MTSFSVIGLGTFGHALARALARLGAQVTAVDNLLSHVESVKDEVHSALVMDARDRTALAEKRIHDVDCAVVCMGEDFEATEICAVHLIDLGCPRVLVRGTSRERVEILEALGPQVITPGLRSAGQWAVRLVAPGLVDYATLAGDQDVALVRVPESTSGGEVFVGPGDDQGLHVGDELILLGGEADLVKVARGFCEPTCD